MRFIYSLLSQFFRWLASRNEYRSTPAGQVAETAKQDHAAEQKIQQGAADVRNGNEDAVSRRIKRLTRPLCVALVLALTAGCVSRVVYVPEDQQARRVAAGQAITAKVDSWLVPDGVFAILLEKAERYENQKKEIGK